MIYKAFSHANIHYHRIVYIFSLVRDNMRQTSSCRVPESFMPDGPEK
jgi:hypothetical protein